MARDGFRIFDSDTHVGPDARILAGYLSEAEKDRLQGWEPYKSKARSGHETYTRGQRRYRRRLGMAEPDEAPSGYMAGFSGVKRTREPSPLVDADPSERIKDMDHEGVDKAQPRHVALQLRQRICRQACPPGCAQLPDVRPPCAGLV
jgi:hypothetical protein